MSSPEPSPRATTGEMLARIDGKLDVVAVRLDAIASGQADHEQRIRTQDIRLAALEARPAAVTEPLEERLRVLELRPTVSPRQLVAAAGAVIGTLATLSPLLARIYGG